MKILPPKLATPNEYEHCVDGTTKISLSGKYGVGMFALVDTVDYPTVYPFRWYGHPSPNRKVLYACSGGYIEPGMHRVAISMHRLVLGLPDSRLQVDHANHNGVDNRRINLRMCDTSQNRCNTTCPDNNKSGFKGVTLWIRGERQYWRTRITKDNQQILVGYFKTKRDAVIAYNVAAIKLHGEFARLNEITCD